MGRNLNLGRESCVRVLLNIRWGRAGQAGLLLLVFVMSVMGLWFDVLDAARPSENQPPDPPVLISPSQGGSLFEPATDLRVQVSDPDGDPLTVTFYVRPLSFTFVHIPDTQRLVSGDAVRGITTWIVNHRVDKNIPYAVQVGDITEGDNASEWQAASAAMAILEDPLTTGLTDGVPYGILAGNHDSIANFDTYFGVDRFIGRWYYSGHYPSNSNQNSYSLFSAGGMDFIAINLSDCPLTDEINWADSLLKAYSSRRGIVSTHTLFPWVRAPEWHPCGQAIFNGLSDNSNFFLLLGGHCRMEAWRQDVGASGTTVYSIAADFTNQMSDNIRLMEFSPGENLIHVRTYSPKNDAFETDGNSQFDLAYDMSAAGFALLGSVTNVASGAIVERTLHNLVDGVEYEWYVVVSDGSAATTGATWQFTNSSVAPPCHRLTLGHTGEGTDPVAAPSQSSDCPAGDYLAGELISLSGAIPASGWHITGWTGTDDDSSTDSTNSLTMPVGAHTVQVSYTPYEYSVEIAVVGNGQVSHSPGNPYTYGEIATLEPIADAGWIFAGWSGANASELSDNGDGTWDLTMDGDKAVTATFVDVTPPDTRIDAGPADPTNETTASFEFSSNEEDSTFACRLDAGEYSGCSSPQAYMGLVDGEHTFAVQATDAAGNTDVTPASYTWTVDTVAPETSIDARPADPTNEPTASFAFSSSEEGATFACRLDAGEYSGCSSPQAYTGLADGEHTFEVQATDAAGNTAVTPASYTWTIDATPPELTITGATADGAAMAGDLATGYILETTNDAGIDHLIQFAEGTEASEALADEYFGLYLSNSSVDAAELKAYYDARAVSEPYLSYLKGAVDGLKPFVYIKGASVRLVDAAKHDLQGVDVDMTVPDDYPLGTYTVAGEIRDLVGNETPVTLILIVTNDQSLYQPAAPVVSIRRNGGAIWLTWPAVTSNAGGGPTVITKYQVFLSDEPYFTPDPTPDTGNLVAETTELEYRHDDAAGSVGHSFYIVRAVSSVGPSANSNRVGAFIFSLSPGSRF